eukprot:14307640-Alexandrium_andersonii.AAC.1
MNWRSNLEAVEQRMRNAGPIARLCGQIAQEQLARGRHFVQEQPRPSTLYEMEPWPRALKHECVVSITYDRCACGPRSSSGPRRGMFY